MVKNRPEEIKETLNVFLKEFKDYYSRYSRGDTSEPTITRREKLQKNTTIIAALLTTILGNRQSVIWGKSYSVLETLSNSVIGGNYIPQAIQDYENAVTLLLNQAIGAIEEGLWPLKQKTPILLIKDNILMERCYDLLQAPNSYDRVIREATTILEDRIRNKVPHPVLSKAIPLSKEQTGEKLVNAIFAPKNPILIFSTNEHECRGFYNMLIGVVSHLRNPHHHKLDDNIEWSWAWSIVGLTDRLLTDIDSCELNKDTT